MNVTQWFDGEIKPVHVGVYERDMTDTQVFTYDQDLPYAYWNGIAWCCSAETANVAANEKDYTSIYQTLPWRGVAKDE